MTFDASLYLVLSLKKALQKALDTEITMKNVTTYVDFASSISSYFFYAVRYTHRDYYERGVADPDNIWGLFTVSADARAIKIVDYSAKLIAPDTSQDELFVGLIQQRGNNFPLFFGNLFLMYDGVGDDLLEKEAAAFIDAVAAIYNQEDGLFFFLKQKLLNFLKNDNEPKSLRH